ncbi:hypothetical protein OCF63_25285, partial [Bacillus wiedmannii]|uniref:hypothetical protein n=1 Tax=Bacillus wiedmannii TaxID=1890302 RepID=UPI0021D391F9
FVINIILIDIDIDITLTIRRPKRRSVYSLQDFKIYIGENFLLWWFARSESSDDLFSHNQKTVKI